MVAVVSTPDSPSVSSVTSFPKVLLLDDDRLVLRSLVRTLASEKVEVVAVDDPREAMQLVANDAFDAVVCDIRMPNVSGLSFARFVRSQHLDVPILLMTGHPQLESAIEGIQLGIFEYLPKPIDIGKLRGAVQRAVKISRLARVRREAQDVVDGECPSSRAQAMASALDRAIASLWVAFQPIVCPRSATVFGYEALLRSTEPELPSPPQVIAAAERLGRTHEVGSKVRALAVTAFAAAPADALLFLNVLPHDLTDDALYDPDSLVGSMASRIVLEMTERADLAKVRDALPRVQRLRALGYRIAVDDLGAGYAGLSSFTALEPEFTKLDMSLVRGAHASGVKQRVVGTIATLCRDLGSRVVAEGIETAEDRSALVDLGCELMQGYFFARPGRAFPSVTF